MKIQIEKPRLLIVEGTHEELLFRELMKVRGLPADVQIMPIGGKSFLNDNIQALIRDPNFPRVVALGIVRDADYPKTGSGETAAKSAWDAVLGCLRNAGLPLPVAHAILIEGQPRTGVFIMPDGISNGMLETLCVASVAAKPEFACVRSYFECLANHQIIPVSPDKAHAHAYLASRPAPDVHVGVASRNGDWELATPAFDEISAFIQSMLAIP
jgi:hypothetical protein